MIRGNAHATVHLRSINSILAVIYLTKIQLYELYIKSILAVIYVNKQVSETD